MLPFARFHAATLLDLHRWSTLSRNEVRPFLARFGIHPLGTKYPMLRVYEHLLGLSPASAAEELMLGGGLMRVTTVAEWFGVTGEALLDAARSPNNMYPPLYALGPKRHLVLKAQVEQLLSSPKNAFHGLPPIPGHAVPASRLARTLEVSPSRIEALLVNKDDLPARVISQGSVRYIVSDVAHRLAATGSNEGSCAKEKVLAEEMIEDALSVAPISTCGGTGGLFSAVTKHAIPQRGVPRPCTQSGFDARRGDRVHARPSEAKLSGI
ncbi:hypothetical protein [Roseicyclus marinus]|uniref:hypothetical protein n=1 Tax=Roseicyclus marinus TaxID=2161673 RepID=UPI00240FFDB1|nr:hypothetical protein [Roseicyclus marinus]MDG3043134.1 hypothetical protein [Roseicyclus marinus]